jgi:ClpP class serine protease
MKNLILSIMSVSLLLGLSRTNAWAIEPQFALGAQHLVVSAIKGDKALDVLKPEHKNSYRTEIIGAGSVGLIDMDAYRPGKAVEAGSVGVINLEGIVTKGDYCTIGTKDWTTQLALIESNPNFIGTIINIDSPGGSVDGTQTFADAVFAAKKPVVGLINDGMAASAAYWIASQCTELFATHETAESGSIGVFVQIPDFKAFYEAQGLPIHIIYSDLSADKNSVVLKALEGDYEPIKKEVLNPIAEQFIAAVKRGRGAKITTDEVFAGKMYMASKAKKAGLIDGVKTFEQAVSRVKLLSNSLKIA